MTRRAALGVAFAVGLGLAPAVTAEDQDAVEYRGHVMQTLAEQLAAIDMVVEHKAPADSLAIHAKVLAIAATQAKKAFEPKVPGGKSRPEVWSNWPDFARRLDAMVAAADSLAKAARAGDPASVTPRLKSALDCEACHALYMTPPAPTAAVR